MMWLYSVLIDLGLPGCGEDALAVQSRTVDPISPEQCRAARAALNWTILDTYRASKVSNTTLVKFEAGNKVSVSRLVLVQAAFEAQGITFAPDGRGVSW